MLKPKFQHKTNVFAVAVRASDIHIKYAIYNLLWAKHKKNTIRSFIESNFNKAISSSPQKTIIFIMKLNAVIIQTATGRVQRAGAPQEENWYCTKGVIRPRLVVITPQLHDGMKVLLISRDHIPLADWAINQKVVIPAPSLHPPHQIA